MADTLTGAILERKCKKRGHNWGPIKVHTDDAGNLQKEVVTCKRCGKREKVKEYV